MIKNSCALITNVMLLLSLPALACNPQDQMDEPKGHVELPQTSGAVQKTWKWGDSVPPSQEAIDREKSLPPTYVAITKLPVMSFGDE